MTDQHSDLQAQHAVNQSVSDINGSIDAPEQMKVSLERVPVEPSVHHHVCIASCGFLKPGLT